MKKVLVAAAVLAAWASAGSGAGIGINWTAGGRVYGPGGERGIAADGAVVWQLVCAGPDGVADHVDRNAADWIGGDDVLLAVRYVPAGGGVASDGTEWTECLEKLGGDSVFEDVWWRSEDGCFVYQRIYQNASGANIPGDVYYQSGLFSARMTYDGWGPAAFPDVFGAAAGAPDGAVSASLHEIPAPIPEDRIDWCEDGWAEGGSWKDDAWSSGDWHFEEVGETHVTGLYTWSCDHEPTVRLRVEPNDGTIGLSAHTLEMEDGLATFEVTLLKAPDNGGAVYTICAVPGNGWDSITHQVTVGNPGVTWQYTVTGAGSVVTGAVPARGNLVIPSELGGHPVTGLGAYAFGSCDQLSSVIVPDSVTEIGDYAFALCGGLTNAVLGKGVARIGNGAFEECGSLTYVNLPDGLASIGENAFVWCYGLKSVTIPGTVASIGKNAFRGCNGLEAIGVEEGNANYMSDNGALCSRGTETLLLCPAGKTGSYAMSGGLVSIGDSAFSGCRGLTEVKISGGVTNIGGSAFQSCDGLASLSIPEGVERIGAWAFAYCQALDTVVIPDSVTFLGNDSFRDCKGLRTLSVPGTWKGTSMLASANVPSGCNVVYRAPPPVEVPLAWLEANAPAILSDCCGYSKAAAVATAANGMPVWACYVAGLDPADAGAAFKAALAFDADGRPVVVPGTDPADGVRRVYAVEGAETPGGAWGPTNAATRFFRLGVKLGE